ncbi:hypothetical protein PRIPAC_78198 [Pristionchus pacificus]|nr:hypothetical protein PRIPAC_78198 [Pristionchus pacificus]
MDAIHYLASLYTFLILMGLCTNSLIVVATIKTKSLHSTCNILIAFCAFSDIVHQMGHLPKILPIFEGTVEISSIACSISQIIPNFGLSAGVILVFLISIDRLLSVHFSPSFINKNTHIILMCHVIAIIAYASLQYSFAFIYFEERNVICSPPEIYHGRGKELWGITSLSVIVLSIIVYYVVWRELKNTGVKAVLNHSHRIFRSVFAVMCTLILGWLLTMTIIVIDRFVLDLEGRSMYIGEEVAGIPANTALTLNCFVLYNTSIEYRNAFRRQLRTIPIIKRLLSKNKILSLSFETTIVKSQSS